MGTPLEIYAFGGLTIRRDGVALTGFASRKVEALLIYLACTGRPHSREFLAEFLWEERSQAQSMGNLRQALFDLRQRLAPYIIVTRQTVAWNPGKPCWLDVVELERQLGIASQQWLQPDGLPSMAAEQLAHALTLYQGDFLEGFYVRDCKGFEHWILQERERLRRQVIAALLHLVYSYLNTSTYTAAIAQATQLLQLAPLLHEAHLHMT